MFALALLSLAVDPVDRFAQGAWGTFSRYLILAHRGETVDVAIRIDRRTQQRSYIMRLTRTRLSEPNVVLWADSRTCPAMQTVLVQMQALTPPRPAVPGVDPGESDIVLDGADYRVSIPARFPGAQGARLEFSSNVDTPLAGWVSHSLQALEGCWSSAEPQRG